MSSFQQAAITVIVLSVGGYYAYGATKEVVRVVRVSTTLPATMFPAYRLPDAPPEEVPFVDGVQYGPGFQGETYIGVDGKRYKVKAGRSVSFVPVSSFQRNPHLFDLDPQYKTTNIP